MIETRLFDEDIASGIKRYFHYDHNTDEIIFETKQHLDPIAEEAKRIRNNDTDWGPNKWKGDWHLVGQIPSVVMTKLRREGIADDPEAFAKWFNSPEGDPYRAKTGKIPLR